MFYYTSKSILGLPPAPKIIVGQYLDEILNKDYMADKERATRIIVMITVIGFVIALIATIYIMYHFTQPMVELAQSNADMAQSYASSLNISDVLHNISEKIGVSNSLLDNSGTPIQNITTIMK